MEERQKLLKRVQVCDFVMMETHLYLDTHPDDTAALEYFHKYRDMRRKAAEEYNAKFGPISPHDVTSVTHFDWVDKPWPWERQV